MPSAPGRRGVATGPAPTSRGRGRGSGVAPGAEPGSQPPAAGSSAPSDPSARYAARRRAVLGGAVPAGPARRRTLATDTDHWLAALHDRQPEPGTALVALGGYGRRELSPGSDLDLLLLHDGAPAARVAALADRLWYPVWDAGVPLDHSVRTPTEARNAAARDLRVQLGLLDARHLAGDPELTRRLHSTALADWRAHAPRRLPELLDLVHARGDRHGELRFLLEGDLKEARGGLRDATALRAVAASWLTDAPRRGLAQARTALLDVRDALHLATGRSADRLLLQDQPRTAAALGLPDADALLRHVYEAAHTIGYASDSTWRDVSRILRARSAHAVRNVLPGRRTARRSAAGGGPRTPLADGVVAYDGEASLARTARPEDDPVLPLRAAAAAARAGLPLNPSALRRLARSTAALPSPWPGRARRELVSLLGAGRPAVRIWESLDAAGLVTSLLPEWEHVRCRPQRNPVHRWTVDRHLCETAAQAAALTRRVRRPDLLLVAALLHDIGKGRPGDHSVAGAAAARGIAARMGFCAADTEVIGTLVRHHLLLAETATRRNLDDPATLRTVAAAVGRKGTLDLLHALTEADALATGPAAWSAWRAHLVSDLVERVSAVLGGEAAPEPPDPDGADARSRDVAAEAVRTGGPALALDRGRHGARLLVALPDRQHALSTVAGVLALHRLTVRSAAVHLLDGAHDRRTVGEAGGSAVLVLDWSVAAEYGDPPSAERLRADLVRALDGGLDLPARLAEREAAYRTPRRDAMAAPPQVAVAHAGSSRATVIEVRAQDAPGLLHRVGRALERTGARVRSAHVGTLGADAVDAFYVTDGVGAPLPDGDAADLARRVARALTDREHEGRVDQGT
ncbi:[protein-PII] uridylyltransferase [Streptomyces sp. TR02-1]|uniref:[protein-PII] uridylyltransferase n=1 Tax=Streptomyces sp. TR02-1 TaxID=3385977 RepID=UPI0039A2FB03